MILSLIIGLIINFIGFFKDPVLKIIARLCERSALARPERDLLPVFENKTIGELFLDQVVLAGSKIEVRSS